MDICRFSIRRPYVNKTFTSIAKKCYAEFGAILFAVRREVRDAATNALTVDKLWINPACGGRTDPFIGTAYLSLWAPSFLSLSLSLARSLSPSPAFVSLSVSFN